MFGEDYQERLFLSLMNTERRIRVVLVDDHRIVLDGLVSMLGNDPAFVVLSAVGSAEEAVEFLKKDTPDIVITDYSLPGMSGMELTRLIKRNYPAVKVVALSMHDEGHMVKSILKEGVDGYLLKNIQHFELKNALKYVMAGMPYVSPEITKLMMEQLNAPSGEAQLLTERESDIVRLIAKEYSNKQIAEKLFISERTVETHRKNIFRKTNTSSIVGLVKFALEHKLV
ncbi:MAG: response regulator transcription factor [Cyclobacteriaceae bacterium]|nr:response regulator transcription factor [Cyclobacteriaceae bacterium]